MNDIPAVVRAPYLNRPQLVLTQLGYGSAQLLGIELDRNRILEYGDDLVDEADLRVLDLKVRASLLEDVLVAIVCFCT